MVTIDTISTALVQGISVGMMYVLVALGLTLIFGFMDVINFAHGAFITIGAYVGVVSASAGYGFWPALLLAPLVGAVVGIAIERGFLRRTYDIAHIYQLLLTFGIALVIEGALMLQFTSNFRSLSAPASLSGASVGFGPVQLPLYRLFLIVMAGLLVVGVWAVIQRTKIGLIVRAGIQDRERLQLLGINIGIVNMFVFGLGAGLAAIAGLAMGPVFGINPQFGTEFLIVSFAIIIIGGIGNIRGTIIVALLVGVLESFASYYTPTATGTIVYVLMIVVLLVKPTGLFGGERI